MVRRCNVIVVGCGPVGLVMTLALLKRGIPVTALESLAEPIEDQRASLIQPPSLEMLDDLGIAEGIIPLGATSTLSQYCDRVSGELIARFDYGMLKDDTRYPLYLQYEQYKLVDFILAHLEGAADLEMRFSTAVTDIAQSGDGVVVTVENPDGDEEKLAADYVIGCDGGGSAVRKCAAIDFAGFTYPERFLKIATDFDFASVGRELCTRNYFSDPDEWCNLFRLRSDRPSGIWRLLFPTRVGETDAQCLSPESMQARMQKFFPKSGDYPVLYTGLYDVHQRVAETFRKGRILLAGDSAHVTNPTGGLGMNGGFHDAVNLAEKLDAVLGGGDEDLLDLYSRQRHKVQMDDVQAQAIRLKKLNELGGGAVRKARFDDLRRAADDEALSHSYVRRMSLLDSLDNARAVT